MSNLISGKEALIALANGELVLIRHVSWDNFDDLTFDFSLHVFRSNDYEFRLKPKTITLNGIEAPTPFEPKKDMIVYIIDDSKASGYRSYDYELGFDNKVDFIGMWQSEEEIKQVIEALRSIFK